jgi:hypothetical protein
MTATSAAREALTRQTRAKNRTLKEITMFLFNLML